jgi:CubicO group peptidase (beta-lactamase class C family)
VQAGEVVFEAGQNGDPSDAAYPLYNASESFWGLVGAAADADGWLDLDEPVRFTIEEFAADALKRDIRIRQLLHYTSGLEPGVQALQRDHTPDLYQRSITLQAISTPGERFQYGPSHVTVFAEVLSRKLGPRGGDPLRYLEERILARIGLAVSAWERDAVLPADAVDAVVARSEASPEFGLGIWRNVSEQSSAGGFYPQGLPEMVVAAGVGNQRLYVIPSLELVVVRFGRPDRRWLDREFLAPLVAIDSASPDGSVPAG